MASPILTHTPQLSEVATQAASHFPYKPIIGQQRCRQCKQLWTSRFGCVVRTALLLILWSKANAREIADWQYSALLSKDDLTGLQSWIRRKDVSHFVETETEVLPRVSASSRSSVELWMARNARHPKWPKSYW